VATSSGLFGLGTDAPYPFLVPVRYTFMLGDPERGPEPDPQHLRFELEWDEERVQATVNRRHPFRDYGNFQLLESAVFAVSNGRGLSDITDEAILEVLDRYEPSKPWEEGTDVYYSVLRPPEEATMPEGGWPLVIYCPGVGAIGRTEIPRPVLSANYPDRVPNEAVWATDYFRAHFPAYVLAMHPQGRTVEYGTIPYERTSVLHAYLEVIDHLMETEPIDPHRLYPIGFSMGGSTVWQLMLERPNFFAAAAPLAGNPFALGNPEIATLKNTPIWMQVGNRDTWNGSARYIQAYQELEAIGARSIRFWEIQDLRHEDYPLNSLHLPEWLFAQRLFPPPVVLETVRIEREEASTLELSFPTQAGFLYWVQKGSGTLGETEWMEVPDSSLEGTGEVITLTMPVDSGEPASWYRFV